MGSVRWAELAIAHTKLWLNRPQYTLLHHSLVHKFNILACKSPVYMIQPVVKPVVKPVWQPVVSCIQTFNRHQTSNRLSNRLCCQTRLTTGWMFVYTIQPVVKPVVQLVWQPVVSCKRGLRVLQILMVKAACSGFKLKQIELRCLLQSLSYHAVIVYLFRSS